MSLVYDRDKPQSHAAPVLSASVVPDDGKIRVLGRDLVWRMRAFLEPGDQDNGVAYSRYFCV